MSGRTMSWRTTWRSHGAVFAAHPYAIFMEIVHLAANAEVTMYPWHESKDLIPQAAQHVRDFLRAHRPVTAAR
jgi:hypothetical protein